MNGVRVFLANLPKILRSILLAKLEVEEGLELICWDGDDKNLSEAIREYRPDVLIADGDRSQVVDVLGSIVDATPDLEMISVNYDGRQACLYKLSPSRHDLGKPSPDSLVGAVRAVLYSEGNGETP